MAFSCGSSGDGGSSGAAGQTGTGGTAGSGGIAQSGGAAGSGGVVATGGQTGTGGTAGTGGTPQSGGAAGTGGTGGTGGTAKDGGTDGSAGASGGGGSDGGNPNAGLFKGVCSPTVTFVNKDAQGVEGMRFNRIFPDPQSLMVGIANTVCEILYKAPAEVPHRPAYALILETWAGGVAYTGSCASCPTVIHLNTDYTQRYDDVDLPLWVIGVLVHETTHVFQYNDCDPKGGLIEGVAEYVRIRAGYPAYHPAAPGGAWDDGYDPTAWFLIWLDNGHPGFGYQVNQSCNPNDKLPWSANVFNQYAGNDVITLWAQYQATF
jgi:hypothetical protein